MGVGRVERAGLVSIVLGMVACRAPARLSVREAVQPGPRIALEAERGAGRAQAPAARIAALAVHSPRARDLAEPPLRALPVAWRPTPPRSGASAPHGPALTEPPLRALPVLWRPAPARTAAIGRAAPPIETDPAVAVRSRKGLHLDFGAGYAPYDDGARSLELLPEPPRGFSDTVLQMGYRGALWRGASWTGGLAAMRYQDEPLMEALEDAEWAWVAVGLRISF